MHKILAIYSQLLQEHLTNAFQQGRLNDQDPQNFNQENFRVRALFIASIIFRSNQPDTEFSFQKLKKWLSKSFGSNNFFSGIIKSSDDLQDIFNLYLSKVDISSELHVATLYETLLSVESGSDVNVIKVSNDKNYRNKLGSYYTPSSFARFVTYQTIDTYFKQNLAIKKLSDSIKVEDNSKIVDAVKNLTFADFSCGAGNFINEIVTYFEAIFALMKLNRGVVKKLLERIALNVTAIDVDPIALEVCKLNMLLRVGIPDKYDEVSKSFIHGNFLLHTTEEKKPKEKIDIFSKGFIYHDTLAINVLRLKGFDICLGNPPWEKIRFEEKRFFSLHANRIAFNHVKKSRDKEVKKFEIGNSPLAIYSKEFRTAVDAAKEKIKGTSFYKYSNRGELNTYSLFTEAAFNLSASNGVVGLVLKSAITTSQINKDLFNSFIEEKRLLAVYDFINKKKIFNIDSRERFCFLLLGKGNDFQFSLAMNLTDIEGLSGNLVRMEYKTLNLINPLTGMIPNVSAKDELDILISISKKFPIFNKAFSNVRFGRIVHLTLHASFITRQPGIGKLAIYEGKFLHQFDSKYSGFNGVPTEKRYENKSSAILIREDDKLNPSYFPESRFYIPEDKWKNLSKNYDQPYMLAWRSLTSATNSRTSIATILPFIPATQSVQFLVTNANDTIYLCGLFNSIVFDFLLKMKLNGIDLTKTLINQIPVPTAREENKLFEFEGSEMPARNLIEYLVFLLLRNDSKIKSLFSDQQIINKRHKVILRKELIRWIDLIFFCLYNLTASELDVILLNFKDYTIEDKKWFKNKLIELRSNNSISF